MFHADWVKIYYLIMAHETIPQSGKCSLVFRDRDRQREGLFYRAECITVSEFFNI